MTSKEKVLHAIPDAKAMPYCGGWRIMRRTHDGCYLPITGRVLRSEDEAWGAALVAIQAYRPELLPKEDEGAGPAG